jgi:cobalt-zinc-cadmium efflux system outer membrane protein
MRLALAAISFVLLLARPALAEQPGMDAYVSEVLARNPSLRAGALRRDALHEDAVAASKWPDPYASVMVDRVPQSMGGEMAMVRYQLSQMVMWPGKLSLMRDAVEHQRDSAAADLDTRRVSLRFDAERAWWMLTMNARRREVNQASRNLASTIAAAALGRYGSGVGQHHDVVRSQVEVNALDVQRIDLEGERTAIVAMMNALRDRPADDAIADPPTTPSATVDMSVAALVERAVRARPELRSMRAMQDEALAMASLARKTPYPDLMGSVWMNQNIGAPASMGVMVGGTIPVFGVSREQHRASAFDQRADAAAQDQTAMRAMIRAEVAEALVHVQTASRRLDLVEHVALPKARESFESALAGYGAGTLDVVGVLDARRALQAAELTRVEAEVDRELAVAELERAVGAPLRGATP